MITVINYDTYNILHFDNFNYFYLAYIFSASGAVLGSKVTVFYNVSQSSMCTCQLDSEASVPCKTF